MEFDDMFENGERVPSRFEVYHNPFLLCIQGELRKIREGGIPKTTLAEYQIDACLQVRSHFERRGRDSPAIIVAPTGAGKSGMAVMLPYVLGSAKVLVLTPSRLITKQLEDSFGLYGNAKKSFFWTANINRNEENLGRFLESGLAIYKGDDVNKMKGRNLVIVNAQKFGGTSNTSLFSDDHWIVENVKEQFRAFDTIIVDEAHHYPARTWRAIVNNFRGKAVIFLTGTPFDASGNPIFPKEDIVRRVERLEIEGVTIRPCQFLNYPFLDKFQEKRMTAVNPLSYEARVKADMEAILSRHDREEGRFGHKAMILVRLKDDAKQLAEALDLAGLSATWVVSDTYAEANLSLFLSGKKRVVVVCGKLGEGFDHVPISLCVILRSVTSRILFQQFTGRCLRMTRNLLPENQNDKTQSTVLTYEPFKQRKNWEMRNVIAEVDPEDDD